MDIKKNMSVLIALILIMTQLGEWNEVEAASPPKPFTYIAVSISTSIKVTNGGWFPVWGTNMTGDGSVSWPMSGLPFKKSFSANIISNDVPPKEYRDFSRAVLYNYDDFIKLGEIPANKDASFLYNSDLKSCIKGGEGLPVSDIEYVSGSKYNATIDLPDKSTMLKLPYTDYGPNDGSNRTYRGYVTFIIGVPHDKFDPDTGKWDIESKLVSKLSSSVVQHVSWGYKQYDAELGGKYGVRLDASASTSARPEVTYDFDMGPEFDNYRSDKLGQKNDIVTLYDEVYPSELPKTRTGSFKVNTAAKIDDDTTEGEWVYKNVYVNWEVINNNPSANLTAIDKGKGNNIYYATRPITITDSSSDPENDLMDKRYTVTRSGVQVAEWVLRKNTQASPWTIVSQTKDDAFVQSLNTPLSGGGEIVFKEQGSYNITVEVGDIRGHIVVNQRTATKTINIAVKNAPSPPVANFSLRLNGAEVDYTYPGITVGLLDLSTDVNGDIVSWLWTKHDGTTASGQEGNTTVFPAEGEYNTKLKVTDQLGLSSTITKKVTVLPPIPNAVLTKSSVTSLKENRRVMITATDSFAPPTDTIQWDKTEWIIEPMGELTPADIKIDTGASTNQAKIVLFKKSGQYKVTIKLYNNFALANPGHPRISLRTAELILTVVEDKKPIPEITVTGGAPNFATNPTSTVAKVTNTSRSDDSDLLEVIPPGTLGPDEYYGRGVDAFKWIIYKDADEDGVYEVNLGEYTGRNVDLPVSFVQGEGTNYRAEMIVKETFGQPTIPALISDADRRVNSTTKDFTIDWVPDIVFNIPTWAYPDDTIAITTVIKDEKPSEVKVVWTVFKQNISGVYQEVSLDATIENSLVNAGGNARFRQSGFYILKATITDVKNQKSSYQLPIRIYPFPSAIITDVAQYRWDNSDTPLTFNAKQNRTYNLLGETSHINDMFGLGLHAIDHSKDYWEIIPMDGQSGDSIKVTNGLLNLTSEVGTHFQISNKDINRPILFKQPGRYKVRYQVTNNFGKKSPITEQIVQIHEDLKPNIDYSVVNRVYRDPSKGNMATLVLFNITINSPDRDTIAFERVRYRFDSNNNGSYDDEVWQLGPAIDKTDPYNWRAEIQKNHVGKYQVEVHAEEGFGQETIDRFITK